MPASPRSSLRGRRECATVYWLGDSFSAFVTYKNDPAAASKRRVHEVHVGFCSLQYISFDLSCSSRPPAPSYSATQPSRTTSSTASLKIWQPFAKSS